ncbi:hypothetical protein F4805DRAFT_3442 [Annulohypoxylon moriforme]|nr:hypothetical protein F4805DRAFT_3442 [Annulohypoxylon moriforme]
MGSLENIPGDVDILIAGCSCVTFSTLNTRKKSGYWVKEVKDEYGFWEKVSVSGGYNDTHHDRLEGFLDKCLNHISSMGSSDKTFFSMISYVRDHRPKIVILENVLQAPWDEVKNVWFPFLGYTAFHVNLDTKNFYIPHTRTRGYLIALDNSVFAEGKTYPDKESKKPETKKLKYDADKIGEAWEDLLKNKLPRRASSEVESWLFPPAHPLTERARQDDSEKTLRFAADTEWERSRIVHHRTRRTEGLSDACDVTQWKSPKEKAYDRLDQGIPKAYPNRVLDCIDLAYLRDITNGLFVGLMRWVFDNRFKNRIFDLSQNIDRSVSGSPLGITGCLTPNGIHYISNQCRMVSGFETLALQGLPLYRMEFATETQDQLRDLAGNAMSTTVVGAVIVALFKAICDQPEGPQKYLKRKPFPENNPEPRKTVDSMMKEIPGFTTTDSQDIEPSVIRELYARSRRYCFCNGAAKYSTGDFVKCTRCSTIRCKWCAGNPRHCFEKTERPANYLLLSEVEQEVMRFFPSTISGMTGADWLPTSAKPLTEATIADVPGALERLRDVTFYYESIRVTEVVTVCYSGQSGFDIRAKLSEKGITWYLYLDPWSKLGFTLRDVLKGFDPEMEAKFVRSPQPIAKIDVDQKSENAVPKLHTWNLWHFTNVRMNVLVVKGEGSVTISEIDMERPGYTDTRFDLSHTRGEYSHFPDCDAPEKSLHAQKKGSFFLFKDASRILTPDLDGFVISTSCRQLEGHEYREVMMKFDAEINMTEQETGTVNAYVDGYWNEPRSGGVEYPVKKKSAIFKDKEKLRVLGSRQYKIGVQEPEQHVLAEAQIVRETECDPYKVIASYKARCGGASDEWAIVTKADLHHLHSFISHINVKLAGVEDLEISFELQDIGTWLENLKGWKDGMRKANPRECPHGQLPPLRWIRVGKSGTKYIGHHLTDAMLDFEKRQKSRIPIFEPRVKYLPQLVSDGKMHAILVQYLFQHKILGQKAAAFLPPTKDPKAKVTAAVQIERNVVLSQNMQVTSDRNSRHKFEPFRNALRSLENCRTEKQDSLGEFKAKLGDWQLKSLARALDKEKGIDREGEIKTKFIEQEIEEEIVPELKLRLVGRAKRIVTNHGGVLADDVGFGKTVVMLALAHCQEEFDSLKAFQQRRSEIPTCNNTNCNYLKATLVVVPDGLVDQWAKEALRFLPIEEAHVIQIRSISDLQDDASLLVLEKLRKARIIVVSVDLFCPKYYQRLARLSGSLDPPDISTKDVDSSGSRSWADWYEGAASEARAHMNDLFGCESKPDIEKIWRVMDKRTEDLIDEYALYARDLSRRKTKGRKMGGEVEDGEDIMTNVQASHRFKSHEELTEEVTNGKFVHILDGFTFARAVYDEFSYQNFPATTFFANCEAHAKWILSATPPTANLAAVQGIANLVNIHIARPIYLRAGMPRITEGPVLGEQTNAEALQHRKLMSDSCIRERHEKAIEFLQTFATSNPLDKLLSGGITVEERVIVCELNKQEAIQYMTLEQDLRACGLDANMLSSGCRGHLQTLIDPNEWTEDGRNVGMKLFLAQSSCSSDSQTLQSLLEDRSLQAQRAMTDFKVHAEKAVWLALRVLDSDVESTYINAKTPAGDIVMLLKDIWSKNLDSCRGLDAWKKLFEALDVGEYEFQKQKIEAIHPNFFKNDKEFDDKSFLRFLYNLRKSSWNDYFILKAENIKDIGEEEARDLLDDLRRAHGNTLVMPNNPEESNKIKLEALIRKQGQGLENIRQTGAKPIRKPIPASTDGKKRTKPILSNLLRSAGVIQTKDQKRDDMEKRLNAHNNGELADSEYVGINDYRAIARTDFPLFGTGKKVRGGNYTDTSSETSDTSVGLRAAFDQLDLAVKQKRTAENLISDSVDLRCDRCAKLKRRHELHIVGTCGHVLCADHLGSKYCGGGAINDEGGCKSLLEDATRSLALINRPRRFLDNESSTQVEPSTPGISSKSRMIVNCIKGIPKDEQVILFVQFDRQEKELIKAFQKNDISYTTLPDKENDRKVKILKLVDSTAAGANLQYANHVMFACPLLVSLQEDYDKFMKQARGRCVRYGQKKVVHVYHFVTACTVEADILELRRQSRILARPGKAVGRLQYDPLIKIGADPSSDVQDAATTNSASAPQVANGDASDEEQRMRSMLTPNEIYKAMNESNWLSTVGIEY